VVHFLSELGVHYKPEYSVHFIRNLHYTDDVDLNKKLEEWEKYYNLHRPHTSHGGFTPYEVLRAKLENKNIQCQP